MGNNIVFMATQHIFVFWYVGVNAPDDSFVPSTVLLMIRHSKQFYRKQFSNIRIIFSNF